MKVLFIGESWVIHMIHQKGFDSFTSTKYEEGATFLLDSLKGEGVDLDYMPAHQVQVRFPKTLEELQNYQVIIISDIGSNTFLLPNETFYNMKTRSNPLTLIRDYVKQGGGLLMIGGYLSFTGIEAKANYKNSPLAEVLPVTLMDHDDRVEEPAGLYPKSTSVTHAITAGIEDWPMFLGYNKFVAKSDAQTLVTIEDDPFLVIGKYQKGKVACFASDCAPHWGSEAFMDWAYYTPLWMRILNGLKSE
ncbi:glutamine amidotransferase [Amphibacillus jilinensis]|uniref:glutamine amidotransferase n=1 Tax=Amphibacillus jilinensis TaxID=1216008 RepID=UPI0002EA2FF2|nr:glutamine amidotransferase [Amphibacillus jilinensis]